MKTLILHLGVHKTATTFIQNELKSNINKLKENDFLYIELSETRKNITSNLERKILSNKLINEIINSDFQTVLISDENIIGGTEPPEENFFYPNAEKRIENLIKLFPHYNIEVYLTLRDFCSFVASMYSEYLRHYKYIPFSEYEKNLNNKNFYWSKLVSILEKNERIEKIRIFNFDDFSENKNLFLNKISKEILNEFKLKQKRTRKTITKEAIEFISLFPQRSDILRKMESCNYIHGTRFSPYTNGQNLRSKLDLIKEIEEMRKKSKIEIME